MASPKATSHVVIARFCWRIRHFGLFKLIHGHLCSRFVPLLGVALFATRNAIALVGHPTARDRHQVIHRQILRRKFALAVVAKAFAELVLPPLGGTQLTGFGFLFLLMGLRGRREIKRSVHQVLD